MHMEYIQGYIAQIAIPVKTVAYIHTKRAVMQKTWNMVNTFGQKKRGINMPDEFYEWLERCPVKIVGRDLDKYVWKYTFLIPIKEKEDTDG